MSTVIDELRLRMANGGMTQTKLAEVTGLARPSVCNVLGQKVDPRFSTLLRVAAKLNCRIVVLPLKKAKKKPLDDDELTAA